LSPASLAKLTKRGVSLLRLSSSQWEQIQSGRRLGKRFSLNFPHHIANEVSAKSLVLISAEGQPSNFLAGLIGSIGATATLDSRVVFDFVHELSPDSLTSALNLVTDSPLKASVTRLKKNRKTLHTLTTKLGQRLVAILALNAENRTVFASILTHMSPPKRFDNARAMQWDALKLALKAFGFAEAVSLNAEGDTALNSVRLQEDGVIEHDARSIPGWTLEGSDVTGTAIFRQGKRQLQVITANKRPLEELLGVDLIYFNKDRGALVMVQYKMMEPQEVRITTYTSDDGTEERIGRRDYLVRINPQFQSEIARMKNFDRELPGAKPYRLNPGAFYIKLVRRNGDANGAGIILSLAHLEDLMAEGRAQGERGGLRISYEDLDGHYLRSEAFVELVRSGYIGTRGATTEKMWQLVQAGLTGGRAIVAAIQSSYTPPSTLTAVS
jgi:hypothetical protein